jgi:dipeptidase E
VTVPRLVLASRGIPGLRQVLRAPGRRAVLVPTASTPLADPAIAAEVEEELARADLEIERLDLDVATPEAVRGVLGRADVIAVSGGDPFHLLAAARRCAFGAATRAALGTGSVYLGYSAGAMIAGPTLEPLRLTSPFPAPDGMDLTGLGLTDVLVLPHHDRPGRAERHAAALREFGRRVRLQPLCDGDVAIVSGAVSVIRPGTGR